MGSGKWTQRSTVSLGGSPKGSLCTATSAAGSLTWVFTKSSLSFMETLPTATPMHSTFFNWNLTEDLISFTCRQVAGFEGLEQPSCCYIAAAEPCSLGMPTDTALVWGDHRQRQAPSCLALE